MKKMRKCTLCGKYTLDRAHCGKETRSPHPMKYTVEDRYALYRRMGKNI